VLVADDNGIYRAQLGRFVSSQPDMEVVGFASDGGEAVCLTSLLNPDLVLMDLCMPGLDGFDATKLLASYPKAAKVIALTAHRSPDTEQRCLDAGASAFIRKADVDGRLFDVIRSLTQGGPNDGGGCDGYQRDGPDGQSTTPTQ
jgi:NarL family two-component system response regulator LiaR